MTMLLASCSHNRVPDTYKWPSEMVPEAEGKVELPTIDMQDEKNLVQHIMKALQEYGCFQVINHGISREQMDDVNEMFKAIHNLPREEIDKLNREQDQDNSVCHYYTSSVNFHREPTHYWRDVLKQACSPLEECVPFWPKNPHRYREIVKPYIVALKEMGLKILQSAAQGLGIEENYFENELTETNVFYLNSYPACPDPSSTIGLARHNDPSLLTILHSGRVSGLQLLKDGRWLGVDTPHYGFTVFVGNIFQAVTNGKVKAPVHYVRNTTEARTSEAFFISPKIGYPVKPAKRLLEAENALPLYKPFTYEEFIETFKIWPKTKDTVLSEAFKYTS
ncbi:hypothetical protein vseg_003262 [Gypsophila vaccaria]